MKCGNCGSSKVKRAIRDQSFTYKGEATIIAAVKGDWCNACGEVMLDRPEIDRTSAAIGVFIKTVNGKRVDREFICEVRKKLALGQREAGTLFGGGANAFSRYENGKAKPPVALVQLFRVLERHPELLDEIRVR
jgi:HTH-type transcriptional regulator / antitoxin MqsA